MVTRGSSGTCWRTWRPPRRCADGSCACRPGPGPGAVEEVQIALRHGPGLAAIDVPVDHGHRKARPGSTSTDRRSRTCRPRIPGGARWASFSQVSRTSPMPRCTKVVSEPRAPVSSTGTCGIQLLDVGLGLGVVAAGLLQGPGPGGQIGPARRAAGLGVGGDDVDARLHQVAPVLDLPGVALADQEDDRRGVGGRVVGQARLPVPGDQAALGDLVDVVGQGQGDDVGLQAVDHRTGLLARSAVALVDGQVLADLVLPVLGVGGVDVLVELAGRIVADVQQRQRLERPGPPPLRREGPGRWRPRPPPRPGGRGGSRSAFRLRGKLAHAWRLRTRTGCAG